MKSTPPHEIQTSNFKDVRAAGYTTAVLPIGATEPHNFHLPYGTDNILAGRVAIDSCRLANEMGGQCACLPMLPYGYNGNMRGFPLAISLQPSTITRIVRDIAHSLTDSGLDFLVILNGHGGNELKSIIRELYRDLDLFVCGVNWWESVADVVREICPAGGDHANDMETAGCLHIAPELVKMDQADEGRMMEPAIREFSQGWVQYSRAWKYFAPGSGAGNPRGATAEMGRRLIETSSRRIAKFLFQLSTSEKTPAFPFEMGD